LHQAAVEVFSTMLAVELRRLAWVELGLALVVQRPQPLRLVCPTVQAVVVVVTMSAQVLAQQVKPVWLL
jgi:hypothetical protein